MYVACLSQQNPSLNPPRSVECRRDFHRAVHSPRTTVSGIFIPAVLSAASTQKAACLLATSGSHPNRHGPEHGPRIPVFPCRIIQGQQTSGYLYTYRAERVAADPEKQAAERGLNGCYCERRRRGRTGRKEQGTKPWTSSQEEFVIKGKADQQRV